MSFCACAEAKDTEFVLTQDRLTWLGLKAVRPFPQAVRDAKLCPRCSPSPGRELQIRRKKAIATIVATTKSNVQKGRISGLVQKKNWNLFSDNSGDGEYLRLFLPCKKSASIAFQAELSKAQEATVNAEKFMNVVRRHTSFEELTPTLLREFVEKIVVHECSYDENKTRRQDIEIYYSFVGKVDLPE